MTQKKHWGKSLSQLIGLALAGAAFPLGFAPFSLWPVSLLTIPILWGTLQTNLGRERPFLTGWCFGIGVFGLGTSWIFVSIFFFGGVSFEMSLGVTIAFTLLMALTSGASTWLYRYLFPDHNYDTTGLTHASARTNYLAKSLQDALYFAASWLLLEWFRTWFFSGFPWLFLGYAGLDSILSGYIPIVGVLGTSWIMIASVILPASAIYRRAKPGFAITITLGITLIGFGLSLHSWTKPDLTRVIPVHLVQGNIPQIQKRDPFYFDEHLEIYKTMTQELWEALAEKSPQNPAPHLLIWPEAAIPMLLNMARDTFNDFGQRAQAANAGWITGAPWAEGTPGSIIYHNGVTAAGMGSGFYEKQRLVPFGESLPFPNIVRKFGPLFNLSEHGFSPGAPNQPPLTAHGFQISPFICYEVVFPELVRQQAASADIMLTISNDGWFGRSIGPDQHFQMARARALETGKMLIRVTNNGTTAIVDERGKTVKKLPTYERDILTGSVYPTTGSTPFMTTGHWPILFISFSTIITGLIFRFGPRIYSGRVLTKRDPK